MTAKGICLDDPLFFVPDVHVSDYSQPFSVPLPNGWNELRNKTEWVDLYPLKGSIQRQGWKVHVSATLKNSREILKIVSNICFQMNVTFKHLATEKEFRSRNGKLIDRGFGGKFITCYPNEEILEKFLNKLEDTLNAFDGPYILSDKRWRKGPIYLRYGVFRQTKPVESFSKNIGYLTIDGKNVKDVRGASFKLPPQRYIPEFLREWADKRNDEFTETFPFDVKGAVRFSNCGGIYRAKYLTTGKNVILKEARPFTGIDNKNQYAPERLKREVSALKKLRDVQNIPNEFWDGKVWEHYFTAIEFAPGIPLNRWVTKNFPIYAKADKYYLLRATKILTDIVKVVTKAHAKGLYHQDIHLGNVIIDSHDNIQLIDWEQAEFSNKQKYQEIAAPGFKAWGKLSADQIDWYGVSQIAHYLFIPMIVQSNLVYGYTKQTEETGTRLFKRLNYPRNDLNQFLQLMHSLDKKLVNTEIISKNKILRPFHGSINDLENFGKELIKGTSAIEDVWQGYYDYRSFPVHYYGGSDQLGISFSDLGVLWAFQRLFTALNLKKSSQFEQQTNKLIQRSIYYIKESCNNPVSHTKFGLFDGVAGTIFLINELGDKKTASVTFNALFPKMISSIKGYRLYDGITGLLIVGLYFEHQGYLNSKNSKLLLDYVRRVRSLYLKSPGSILPVGKHFHESNDPYAQHGGLLYGHVGMAWLFSEVEKEFHSQRNIELINLALREELKSYDSAEVGGLQYAQGYRLLPYLSMGSAGLALFIEQNKDILDPLIKNKIHQLKAAINSNFCIFPGLFNGYAGIALTNFFLNDGSDKVKDQIVSDLLEKIQPYLISIADGVGIAGDSGIRLTTDVYSGTAGLALALASILDNEFELLPSFVNERR